MYTRWSRQADKMPSLLHKLFSTGKKRSKSFSLLPPAVDVNVNEFRVPNSAFG